MEIRAGNLWPWTSAMGKTLWHFPLNAIIKTSPMTFAVDGEQFVALAAGSNIVCFGLTR